MCCGKYEGLDAALGGYIPYKAEGYLATVGEVAMAKVYTTVPGAVQRLGSFGEATNDVPAIVPDKVAAAEFEGVAGFKVELDDPKASRKTAAKKKGRKARER